MCGAPVARARVLGLRLNRSQGASPRGKHGVAVGVMRCADCGLIFANPMPIPERLTDHYSMSGEEYWGEAYFELDPLYFGEEIATAKRLLDFRPGMTALDVGAGIGKAMLSLKAAGFEAYGLEPSPSFRRAAIERMGIDSARLGSEPIEAARIDVAFDLITFGASLEHFYHPGLAIERAVGWLKPGGVVHFEVPSSDYLMSRVLNSYFRVVGTNYVTNISPMHPPYHLYEFTLKSFNKHGQKLGYVVREHSFFQNGVFVPLPGPIRSLLSTFMKRHDLGMQLTVWIGRIGHARGAGALH